LQVRIKGGFNQTGGAGQGQDQPSHSRKDSATKKRERDRLRKGESPEKRIDLPATLLRGLKGRR